MKNGLKCWESVQVNGKSSILTCKILPSTSWSLSVKVFWKLIKDMMMFEHRGDMFMDHVYESCISQIQRYMFRGGYLYVGLPLTGISHMTIWYDLLMREVKERGTCCHIPRSYLTWVSLGVRLTCQYFL